jgi:hypothetical protein
MKGWSHNLSHSMKLKKNSLFISGGEIRAYSGR